jgi:hypothetical protein
MKREELLKRTKKELLALAGEKGAHLSAKLRKSELVEQVLDLLSPSSRRTKPGVSRAAASIPGSNAKPPPPVLNARPAVPAPVAVAQPQRPSELGLDPKELHRVSEEISRIFPPPIENTEIVFYEIDPFHAHVFWHVRLDAMEEARRSLGREGGHAALLLRFYDVTLINFDGSNARSSFDVAVHSLRSNYYADFWESGRAYIVDIGLKTHDGRFLTLARSNHIELPPHAPSDNFDRTGVVVDPSIHVVCEVADVTRVETLADISPEPHPDMEVETSDDLVRTFYLQLTQAGSPTLNRKPRGGATASTPVAAPGNQGIAGPFSRDAPAPWRPNENPHETLPRARAAYLGGSGPNRETGRSPSPFEAAPVSSASPSPGPTLSVSAREASSESSYTAENRPASLSSWVSPSSAISSWVTSPGPAGRDPLVLEEIITLPPEELRGSDRIRDFYAELIIQGRVEPGGTILLMGQPVRLRPDGTFHVRRRLGEGTMVVPLFGSAGQDKTPGEGGAT